MSLLFGKNFQYLQTFEVDEKVDQSLQRGVSELAATKVDFEDDDLSEFL